ncbi:nucleoside deaminase [Corynebacterium sp. zg254]|uniref:tRNA-specific adenosine deaminase n=2 Tax=Corynebacteriaceae TaxID=1653 RepID=A0ABQ6VGN5_9CORY|nr:nucleoside deaminase [Corynebacterium zhongnanshanii]MCR5914169.1 nucleoside deaminase [Corynebacterium sp. zg254]
MRRAFEVASATPAGDVPVGAVIVSPQGQELGCGTNRREADGDPLGHAEIAAMREAVRAVCVPGPRGGAGTGAHAEGGAGDVSASGDVSAGAGDGSTGGDVSAGGIDGWRLTGCTAYVTLEPCAMCAGALVGARVHRIVFASYEPNTGACGSVWDIPREHPLHKTQVRGGVLEEQGTALLSEFFARLRG